MYFDHNFDCSRRRIWKVSIVSGNGKARKKITWTNSYDVLTRKYLYKISIIKMRYTNNK